MAASPARVGARCGNSPAGFRPPEHPGEQLGWRPGSGSTGPSRIGAPSPGSAPSGRPPASPHPPPANTRASAVSAAAGGSPAGQIRGQGTFRQGNVPCPLILLILSYTVPYPVEQKARQGGWPGEAAPAPPKRLIDRCPGHSAAAGDQAGVFAGPSARPAVMSVGPGQNLDFRQGRLGPEVADAAIPSQKAGQGGTPAQAAMAPPQRHVDVAPGFSVRAGDRPRMGIRP
jgi:hypothetical protein